MDTDMQSVNIENIISDWEKLCRICLTDQDVLFPVFNIVELDDQYNMRYCEMLNTCSTLKVSSNDNFPQLICSLCITHMRHVLEFRIKCQSSEMILTQLIHKRNDLNTVIKCEVVEVTDPPGETDAEYLYLTETKFVPEVNEQESLKDKSNPITPAKKENIESKCVTLKKMHTCPVCEESCSYRELQSHKKTHPNTCWKCNINFKSAEEHNEHFKEHEENVCSECGKVFRNKSLCNLHKIIHAKDKCLCTICGKKFNTPTNLAAHYQKHTAEPKRYACNYCGKKFAGWSTRRYHIRNHHTLEKPFACDICDKRFAQKRLLIVHLRTHTNEKPFTCKMCDSKFSQLSSLNRHMFKHTGEKRVFCTVCNKGFVTNYNLKLHMVTHTGEKNFVCSVCNKGFSQAHVLRTHMNTHSENACIKKIEVDTSP